MSNIYVFSVYTGMVYDIPEEQFNLLDDGQLPLKDKPKACKKCYDRRYMGFSKTTYTYMPCLCVSKIADLAKVRSKYNIDTTSV